MSEKKALYENKMKKAAQMLLFKRHMKPGVKGWELRRTLGKNYSKILELLGTRLEPLDLQIKTVYEGADPPKTPSDEILDRARFYITVKGPLTAADMRTSGWRIDSVAALAVTMALIMSKQGKSPRQEVEEILKKKFPEWQVNIAINRYIRSGYLTEDENKILYLDWRARAEIEPKTLIGLIIGEEMGSQPT